jgi:hypothetical protein
VIAITDLGAMNLPGRPDQVLIMWMGGMCDSSTAIAVRRGGPGYLVTIATEERPGGCRAAGVSRQVVLRFGGPVAAGTVHVAHG